MMFDFSQQSIGTATWRVAGVSVVGTSHLRAGTVCQDAHTVAAQGEVVVIAVADGAGTAERSDVGARIAVDASRDFLLARIREVGVGGGIDWCAELTGAIEHSRNSVLEHARLVGVATRSLASTLIVLVATPSFVAAAQVGDGGTVVLDADGNYHSPTFPELQEEYNATVFLTAEHALGELQTGTLHGRFQGVAVISDGLQLLGLTFAQKKPFPGFFRPCFSMLSKSHDRENAEEVLRASLESDKVREKTDDDLTLVLAWLVGEAGPDAGQ